MIVVIFEDTTEILDKDIGTVLWNSIGILSYNSFYDDITYEYNGNGERFLGSAKLSENKKTWERAIIPLLNDLENT